MTLNQAIYILRNTAWLGSNKDREQMEEAVEMAVKALESKSSKEPVNKMDDLISRIDAIRIAKRECWEWKGLFARIEKGLNNLQSQPIELIRCKDCIYYDPPHIENEGMRHEYKDMPKEAFDELGTGLVNVTYGINIGGRCTRDYNRGYNEDKRVFVNETNYCGRAERREDE